MKINGNNNKAEKRKSMMGRDCVVQQVWKDKNKSYSWPVTYLWQLLFILFSFLVFGYVCLFVHWFVGRHAWLGMPAEVRENFRESVLSTSWIPETGVNSSGLAASTLSTEPSFCPHCTWCKIQCFAVCPHTWILWIEQKAAELGMNLTIYSIKDLGIRSNITWSGSQQWWSPVSHHHLVTETYNVPLAWMCVRVREKHPKSCPNSSLLQGLWICLTNSRKQNLPFFFFFFLFYFFWNAVHKVQATLELQVILLPQPHKFTDCIWALILGFLFALLPKS